MQLSFITIVDIFIRVFVVGQLSLLCIHFTVKPKSLHLIYAILLCISLSAYLLITAPIANHHYGILRGVFLFFTEVAPYILWLLIYSLFKDDFKPKEWPSWIKVTIMFSLSWFVYFFGYLEGKGLFHKVNHLIELLIMLHVIYITLKDFPDDLVETRRNARVLTVIYGCLYLILILLLELGNAALRDSSLFSLVNAGMVLLSTTIFSYYYFIGKFTNEITVDKPIEDQESQSTVPTIPLVFKDIHTKLCQLMLAGFYQESQLSIKDLASELQIPEHQLRELINKHLGFRNFSEFLNSYRIPAACAQFEDSTNIRTPILTIALELGYGSIATFNRTFKAQKGITPKEYRNQFQK